MAHPCHLPVGKSFKAGQQGAFSSSSRQQSKTPQRCASTFTTRNAQPPQVGARSQQRTWLFDLDNTLYDASHAAFGPTNQAMTDYIVDHLGLSLQAANQLRQDYWLRYGATLLGLVRHHDIHAHHFLKTTHELPGLEERLRMHAPDRLALKRLTGRRFLLTNAPRQYALRVVTALRLHRLFDRLICIEDMFHHNQWRPKPDKRMFRRLATHLQTPLHRCVLVEDTLEHQKAARQLSMTTVWMQRYLKGTAAQAMQPHRRNLLSKKPAYVDFRVNDLKSLFGMSTL
jgi:putative hydrolase of the HAD superfamily